MKNTTKQFLLMAPLLGMATISCGDNFGESKDAGVICVYAGVIYSMGQEWRTQDGLNVCVCGPTGKVLCTQGDGGASDGARVADATGAESAPPDALTPASDAVEDSTLDATTADAPVGGDSRISDAALDVSVSDSRLAAERD